MTDLNPAETYAGLKLLEHAIKGAVVEAAARADEYRLAVRAKSLETDYGTVSVTRRKPTVVVDESALADWAALNRPDVIVEYIAPADMDEALDTLRAHHPRILSRRLDPLFVQAMRAKLVADGDDAVDPDTGESMPWATVKPGTEFLSTRLTAEAKAEAEQYVTDRIAMLVESALPRAVSA